MITINDTCHHSENKSHKFKCIDNYGRDDSGFYLKCDSCNEIIHFDCDTKEDFYDVFGINDEEE